LKISSNNVSFTYLQNKVPRKSEASIKEGVFVGPQIRELIQDVKFEDQLSEVKEKNNMEIIQKWHYLFSG